MKYHDFKKIFVLQGLTQQLYPVVERDNQEEKKKNVADDVICVDGSSVLASIPKRTQTIARNIL